MANNKIVKITAILVLPTVLVLGYYGYKYYRRKQDEKNTNKLILEMREKYDKINNIDDFVEGVKYVVQPIQFGYDLSMIKDKKDKIPTDNFDSIKDIYELIKKKLADRSEEENKKVLDFLTLIFNK